MRNLVKRSYRVGGLTAALGAAVAAGSMLFSMVGSAPVQADSGSSNFLGILSASRPTGYTHSPSSYDISGGTATLNFDFTVTNLTPGQAHDLDLHFSTRHILTYGGSDVSNGQPGQPGVIVDCTPATRGACFNVDMSTQAASTSVPFELKVPASGQAATPVDLSQALTSCGYFQVDVWGGNARFGHENLASGVIRVLGCVAAAEISTTPSAGGVVGTTSIHDTAMVSGKGAGSVTFSLFGPGDKSCSGTDLLASKAGFHGVALSGGSATSPDFNPATAGVYEWVAKYSGDANHKPAASTCGSEAVTIAKATPAISTSPTPTSGSQGVSIHDMATVSGGFGPTGSVSFALYAPGDSSCSGTNLVAGQAAFQNIALTGGQAVSPSFTAGQVGTYNWIAAYSGDNNNNAIASGCGSEKVTTGKVLGVTSSGGGSVSGATLAETGDWQSAITMAGLFVLVLGLALMLVSRRLSAVAVRR
ncbi:MAG: LPXTG cell wall anchor domain-containing protein [Candidatus Dormibacterales bacterium]